MIIGQRAELVIYLITAMATFGIGYTFTENGQVAIQWTLGSLFIVACSISQTTVTGKLYQLKNIGSDSQILNFVRALVQEFQNKDQDKIDGEREFVELILAQYYTSPTPVYDAFYDTSEDHSILLKNKLLIGELCLFDDTLMTFSTRVNLIVQLDEDIENLSRLLKSLQKHPNFMKEYQCRMLNSQLKSKQSL